ncbi:MAG: mechanosensitive ion channel family protein, partial [bacterium]|nr:mechanosensitive ion channel family protein [bacterium]
MVEELGSKGGKVEEYEAYIKVVSGVEVDVSDARATWTVVKGWLISAEGGFRWAKNILFF